MATEVAKSRSSYQSAFEALQLEKSAAPWLDQVRTSAMERFEVLGFPSVAEEEWKYTSLAPLTKSTYQPAPAPRSTISSTALSSHKYPETEGSSVWVQDGYYRKEISQLEKCAGPVVLNISDAVADARYGKIVRQYLARNANHIDNGMTALNTAFIQSGVFIFVPRGTIVARPLQLNFVATTADSTNFPRLLIVAEENSSATIIENYLGEDSSKSYFTNAVTEVVLGEGARLVHYRVQRESNSAYHVGTTAVDLGRSSSYDTTAITLGAKLSRHDISVVMDQEGAECRVDGLYVVGADQHSDTHSLIDHKQPHCSSHQLYKGILDDNGRAVFNGKVFVRRGAQKTDAMQTNKNLLLSPKAHVDTKPQLEIFADDVKCAHGAAVGQLDKEELFYLETRGINPDFGRRLLTYGFAEEVIGKITVDSLRTQLDEAVLSHLHTQLNG